MLDFEEVKWKINEISAKRPWLSSLLLILSILVFAWTGWIAVTRGELRRMEDGIRRRGGPITHDELNAYYASVPDEQNAAPLYEKAWKDFVPFSRSDPEYKLVPHWEWGEWGVSIPRPGSVSNPEDIATLKAYKACLEKNQKSFDLIMNAAKMEGCRFPINYKDGLGMKMEHLAGMRIVLDIMASKTLVAIEEGNVASATELLQILNKIGAHIFAEPDCSAHSLGFACEWRIFRLGERLLNSRALSSEELDSLEKIFEAWPAAAKTFVFASQGERAISYGGDTADMLKHVFCYWVQPMGGDLEIKTISDGRARLLALLLSASGLVYPARINILATSEQIIELGALQYDRVKIDDIEEKMRRRRYNPIWFPAYRLANCCSWRVFAPYKIEMMREIILLAISARRFENENSRLPGEVEDIVPKYADCFPDDIFGHGPLKFRSGPIEVGEGAPVEGGGGRKAKIYKDGITIYSVGPDGSDNAGGGYSIDGVGRHSDISLVLFPLHEECPVTKEDCMPREGKKD